MSRVLAVSAVILLFLSGIAQANIAIDTVTVGDKGNVADTRYATPGYGSVGYNYRIGKYEVTAAQYCDFLNAKAKSDPYGLYNTYMNTAYDPWGCNIQQSGTSGSYSYSVAADWANRPVNYVSYWDACRFANWLYNGQGDGDTETGAYTLNGYNGDDGRTIQRNVGLGWCLTSEDEWYKAAYYRGGGTNAGYWDYPTRSNTAPSNVGSDGYTDPGNHANFYQSGYTIGGPYFRTNVGEFESSASAYGTFDQGGNVWEWNEVLVPETYRGLRGGSFYYSGSALSAAYRSYYKGPTVENSLIGFRVAVVVPVYGISNRAAHDPNNNSIISNASARFNFKVWGRVEVIDASTFWLDDGSGAPVKVVAPGFSGIITGDYASASGEFSGEGVDRILNAQAFDIVKLYP